MATQEEKFICCSVECLSSIAVSQDQRVLSNIGILGKTVFGHLAGK